MRTHRTGQKPLRLLILLTIFFLVALVTSGCTAQKYEAIDLETTTAEETTAAEVVSIGALSGSAESGERAAVPENRGIPESEPETESGGSQAEETETDPDTADEYLETEDRVVVTADLLNVRETDSTDARILVQLKNGEQLSRTGYNSRWSRVLYEGKTAYVMSDMIAVAEDDQPAAAETAAVQAESGQETESQIPLNGHVVAIDAGHQAKANAEKEPIGPGSQTMKAKMPEGAVGAATGVKEYELTLTVAKKLEEELKNRGYRVVMIRTGHDVNLSNAERSEIANESGADIFIRLHANSMENSGVYGALAMCMTEQNPYNAELYSQSYILSKKIIDSICSRTGTKNRGVQKADNSSAINWCKIPVSVVEMGFLSNPDEDRWLQSEDYQGKITLGIADAVDSYFSEGN